MVHDVEEWPLIDEFGMGIYPGTYTLAAITEVSLNVIVLMEIMHWIILYGHYITLTD